MQHISSALQPQTSGQPSTPASSHAGSKPPLESRWIEQLFARFALIWPRAWADQYGAVPADLLAAEWAGGLAGLSGAEIRHGIEHCRAERAWPPSIAEFRKACRGGSTDEQRAMSARLDQSDAERLALPSRTWADRRADGQRQAREALARLRQGMDERKQVQAAVADEPDEPVTAEQMAGIGAAKREAVAALERMRIERGLADGSA